MNDGNHGKNIEIAYLKRRYGLDRRENFHARATNIFQAGLFSQSNTYLDITRAFLVSRSDCNLTFSVPRHYVVRDWVAQRVNVVAEQVWFHTVAQHVP